MTMHAAAHLGLFHERFGRRRDANAVQHLQSLLMGAAEQLRALGDEPICVLECPRQLNKGVSEWRAVRVASYSAYSCVGRRDLARHATWSDALAELRAANAVLQGLIDRHWRQSAFDAFDLDHSLVGGTSLALLVDEGRVLLALQLEYESEGPVYELDSAFPLQLIGVCERMGDLGGVRPIQWMPVTEWAERRARMT